MNLRNSLLRFIIAVGGIAAIATIAFFVHNHGSDSKREDTRPPSLADPVIGRDPDLAPFPVLRSEDIDEILTSQVWDEPLSYENAGKIFRSPMNPEQARLLLERARKEISDIRKLSIISSTIMAALCENGFAAEAWELVDIHPGAVRELEIGTIFVKDPGPMKSLIEKFETLTSSAERRQALHGILMTRPAEMANLDFTNIPLESPDEMSGFASSIIAAIHRSATTYGDPAATEPLLKMSFDLMEQGKLDPDHLIKILKADTTNDAFHQWNLVTALETNESERIRAAVIPNMIKSDADKAMAVLSSSSATKHSYPLLREAIFTMYEVDEAHANNWVSTQLPTLEPETGQRVIASLTQVSIRSGEFDTARQWAGKITNTTIRNQIQDQIRKAQFPNPLNEN